MKIFFSENNADYGTYTFNYAIYAQKESEAELNELYEKGFLPYTGNIHIEKELFYLARSLRVNLENFDDTSENRRVNRQIESLNIKLDLIEKSSFELSDPDFKVFCANYINERIGEDNMSLERWDYILKQTTGTHLFKFSNSEKTLGYVLASITDEYVHYWFAFFDTEYMRSHSLGKWMMWRVIRWSKDNNKKYTYLGTAYKPAALYKIRDHKGLEFFDGKGWNNDSKTLKEWCQTDLETKDADRFKLIENPNNFLDQL
ncbi:GNAT family N-acetyltransferase [Lacihabitans sp. LS3-19]|uniref:GNAT family N-acetyltransferase n=1 Tax=Lacihabitans sp. LS3-19 TaxID=2487335 RepID=UPI0020CD579E|nr:GNAT family N-acetyltransferase [Lacihabitans sp. LS3-19]MCP9769191.1 GNAT family N-acetyltransferase [Lacihabitans sp. LS3-19]